jgi:hypothetical protein
LLTVVLCFKISFYEHWLKPDELAYTHIDNFFIASSYCRPHTKHGGVLILLKKGIKSVPRQDINKLSKEVDCELCAIEIPSWIIVTVYRSPLGNFEDFITIFTAVCELLAKNKNKNVIITGDFNIDINKDNAKKNSFIDLLNSYALHLNVKDNTRVCSTSSSCIDNIITSIYNKVDVDVLDPHLSDHYAIFLDMQYIEKIKVDSVTWTRQMTTNNIKNFCENLDRVDWEFVNSLYTAKEKFEWFFENFLKIFYQCFPKKRQKINNNTENQLWFGKELERKRNVLEALDVVRKCTGSPQTKNLYNKLRIAHKASINQAKKNYYSNLIEKSNNKSSTIWKIVKSLNAVN